MGDPRGWLWSVDAGIESSRVNRPGSLMDSGPIVFAGDGIKGWGGSSSRGREYEGLKQIPYGDDNPKKQEQSHTIGMGFVVPTSQKRDVGTHFCGLERKF